LPKFSSELMQRTGTGWTKPTVQFSSSSVQPSLLSVWFSVLRFLEFWEPVLNRFEQDRTVIFYKKSTRKTTKKLHWFSVMQLEFKLQTWDIPSVSSFFPFIGRRNLVRTICKVNICTIMSILMTEHHSWPAHSRALEFRVAWSTRSTILVNTGLFLEMLICTNTSKWSLFNIQKNAQIDQRVLEFWLILSRVLQHWKKWLRVVFFLRPLVVGLTNYVIRNKSIYGNTMYDITFITFVVCAL